MDKYPQVGELFRDGAAIAERIVLTRRFEPRYAPVAMAGQVSTGFKDLTTQGPTTIRVERPEPSLRQELERLQAGATDIEIGRRDRQWRPRPVSVELDGEVFNDCAIDRPLNGYGPLEEVEFTVHHERL